jgi:hypothetical protein
LDEVKMKFRYSVVCILFLVVLTSQGTVNAQDFVDRLLEDGRSSRDAEFPEIDETMYFDFGFWHKFGYYHYEEPGSFLVEHRHDLRTHSLYAWADLVLEKKHRFYGRLSTISLDYSKGDGGLWDHKIYKPRLDMGFYEYRFEKQKGEDNPVKGFRFRVGRQLLRVGSGLTYSRVHDGLSAKTTLEILDINCFFAQSIPSEDNIDQGKPGNNRQRRNFYGTEIAVRYLPQHTPFVYVVLQRDRQGEKTKDYFANYLFHSNYFGIGSRGSVGKRVNYHVEYIIGTGQRHPDALFSFLPPKENIRAGGFDGKIEYLFEGEYKPVIAFQYMFGSGDRDRLTPTDTGPGRGNEPGTDDTSFVTFGHAETGYALYPLVSNLHIFRLSGSFLPLPRNETFKKLRLGGAFITFDKDRRGGAISIRKPQTLERKEVGWEFDMFVQWEVFSDLLVTFKWGHYQPGNAFPSSGGLRRQLDYFYLGTTLSF